MRRILLTLMLLGLSSPVLAADLYQVNTGATGSITEHGICRKITNAHASGLALHVPTKTAPEWSSVYLNPPAGVTIAACTDAAGLRFRSASSAYLARTPSVVGNRRTWTYSAWVKRTNPGAANNIFSVNYGGSDYMSLTFGSDNTIVAYFDVSSNNFGYQTSRLYRDTTAWYHIVLSVDTTQAVAANRVKLFVNGVQDTTFAVKSGLSAVSQNYQTYVNLNGYVHAIGRFDYSPASNYFEGYMADIALVDGQALLPADFGQFDNSGQWLPKNYAGAYGTNGFRLDFADTSNTTATTMGKDRAGSNNWTPSGFSVTAGLTYDPVHDSARMYDNGSAGVGSYATLNYLDHGYGYLTFYNGALAISAPANANGWRAARATHWLTSGKWRYTVYTGINASNRYNFGIGTQATDVLGYFTSQNVGIQFAPYDGLLYVNGSGSSYGGATTSGTYNYDVLIDVDNKKIWFARDGTILGGGNPDAGTSPAATWAHSDPVVPILQLYGGPGYVNFGQRPWDVSIATASTFKAINTQNMAAPAIADPSPYFKVATYTGNGTYISVGDPVKLAGTRQLANSLRFRSASSTYLTRTGTLGNRQKWTWSGWVKRSTIGTSQALFSDGTTSYTTLLHFDTANQLVAYVGDGASNTAIATRTVFMDPSAWHHIVWSVDTTQATNTLRNRLYVDGNEVTNLISPSYPALNYNSAMNNSNAYQLGRNTASTPWVFDGYMSDVYFLDGSTLGPSAFGETDANGNWVPKATSGLTYGTNGFHLDFSDADIIPGSRIGYDSSGNNNQLTPFNFQSPKTANFVAASSDYLYRTPTAGTNAQKITYSTWFRLNSAVGANIRPLVAQGAGGSNPTFMIGFNGNSSIMIGDITGSVNIGVATNMTFTDLSKWYHLVVAIDTTQAVQADRIKTYVDGVQVTTTANTAPYGTNVWPAQNYNMTIASSNPHWIGRLTYGSYFFDGDMGETYFIDGQQLTAGDFGQAVSGKWVPKAFTGTYGAKGYRLDFTDKQPLADLGKDTSGNGNDFTVNVMTQNLQSNEDLLRDTPTPYTDGTYDHGNFMTLNPLLNSGADANFYASHGNLFLNVLNNSGYRQYGGTFKPDGFKGYFEMAIPVGTANFGVGFEDTVKAPNNLTYQGAGTFRITQDGSTMNGLTTVNGSYTPAFSTGDILQVAFDFTGTNKNIWFGRNGTWGGSSNPAAGTGAAFTATNLTAQYRFYFSSNTGAGLQTNAYNFGQQPFVYTPPTGFKALNTNNVSNTSFTPDLVITKNRSAAVNAIWSDRMRGPTLELDPTSTSIESATIYGLLSYQNGGFTAYNSTKYNTSGNNYVSWMFREGATPGFDIVTYTGNGAARTIPHNLGAKPSLMIIKNTTGPVGHWTVYHQAMNANPSYGYLTLSTGNAFTLESAGASRDRWWNSTEPTASVFSLGTGSAAENNTSGSSYIAYLFAEVPGFSRFGSYTGNGVAEGPFVYTGFKPAMVIIKSSTVGTTNWRILDNIRDDDNPVAQELYPSLSNAESSFTAMDFTANGFKIRSSDSVYNGSGSSYIYIAFAEKPFKYAPAR